MIQATTTQAQTPEMSVVGPKGVPPVEPISDDGSASSAAESKDVSTKSSATKDDLLAELLFTAEPKEDGLDDIETADLLDPSHRSVSFRDVIIREYEQILGDNPAVSYGPPISLDWKYQEVGIIPVDEYEDARKKRRNLRQMMMNYYQRKNTLMFCYGVTEQEMKRVDREIARIQRSRDITKYFIALDCIYEVMYMTTNVGSLLCSCYKTKTLTY